MAKQQKRKTRTTKRTKRHLQKAGQMELPRRRGSGRRRRRLVLQVQFLRSNPHHLVSSYRTFSPVESTLRAKKLNTRTRIHTERRARRNGIWIE
jgi:hypothetical protein